MINAIKGYETWLVGKFKNKRPDEWSEAAEFPISLDLSNDFQVMEIYATLAGFDTSRIKGRRDVCACTQ